MTHMREMVDEGVTLRLVERVPDVIVESSGVEVA